MNNTEGIKKYIDKYKQEYLCHGDLHFENIIHHKSKIYFIDLDYVCVSAKGYDIAMLIYQEKMSKKEDFDKVEEKVIEFILNRC